MRKTTVPGCSEFESQGIPNGHFLPIILSTCQSCARDRYPERNFERNQLLGSSMSLSPLYAALTNDLHVSTGSDVHQPFDWLPPRRVKITTFRVYNAPRCKLVPVNRRAQTRWASLR